MITAVPSGTPLDTEIFSSACIAEGCFVFVSGQGPLVDGRYEPAAVDAEARLAIENLRRVLEASGSSLDQVVRCNVYLRDIADYDEINRVWQDLFPPPRPARTTIQAAALPFGIKVEVDCVALLAPERRNLLQGGTDAQGDVRITLADAAGWSTE